MTQSAVNTSDDAGRDCPSFPDIFQPTPHGASAEERKRIKRLNDERERVYRAVRHVLESNFGFRDALPAEPKDFPGSVDANGTARFCAVYGQLLADNWNDPSLGRSTALADDLIVSGGAGQDAVIVSRRFVDAVVEAVKEHAAHAKLFLNVFGFLRNTSTDTRDARRSV
jgi:hypothetical protein